MKDPFVDACHYGRIKEVQQLLSKINIESLQDGLFKTCIRGHAEILKLLLKDERVDVNHANKIRGWQPLYTACTFGQLEIVKILVNDKRININQSIDNEYTETALFQACYEGYSEIVKVLLNDERIEVNGENDVCKTTPFFIACEYQRIEVVKILLSDERVDVNRGNIHETPFWIACSKGKIGIVKLLLDDERVDINRGNEIRQTPFYIACDNGHIEIVKLLLNDKRVDINTPDIFLWTFLHVLCHKGQIDILEYILASGRDVNLRAKEKNGKTAMDIAREGRYKEKEDWEDEEDFQRRIKNCPKIVKLLESLKSNEDETRIRLKIKLGFAIFDAALIFSEIVLLSDGYLDFKDRSTASNDKNQSLHITPQCYLKQWFIIFWMFLDSFVERACSS